MEFEIEDRPQMGDDDWGADSPERSPQRDRTRVRRSARPPISRQDQAVFIPEQEPGSG